MNSPAPANNPPLTLRQPRARTESAIGRHGEARGSEGRARIDDAVRKVWLAYRDASDVNAEMLTEQDMELWGIVTRHRAIQDRLDATLPNADLSDRAGDGGRA